MKAIFSRIIGISLVIAAVAGMLFSLYGLVQVWRYKPAVTESLTGELEVIHATVTTTSSGLYTVSDTMKTVAGNVQALQDTTTGLVQSIHGAQPLLDTMVKLVGQDLPETITATQTSLNSAASSAVLIDNVMTSVTSLPLLGLNKYAPAVPLHTALGDISTSLGHIPPALDEINLSLGTAKTNLAAIENGVTSMGSDIDLIKSNLEDARLVIVQYQQENDVLLNQVESARQSLPAWIDGLTWAITIGLIWLFITQIGLLLKGWEMTFPSNRTYAVE